MDFFFLLFTFFIVAPISPIFLQILLVVCITLRSSSRHNRSGFIDSRGINLHTSFRTILRTLTFGPSFLCYPFSICLGLKLQTNNTFLFVHLCESKLLFQGSDFSLESLDFLVFQRLRVYFASDLLFFELIFQFIVFVTKLLNLFCNFDVGLCVFLDFAIQFNDLILESKNPCKFIWIKFLAIWIVFVGCKMERIFFGLWLGFIFE